MTSPSPPRVYIQLLSLSHTIRTSIRGTPRELSFAAESWEPRQLSADIKPTITTDALAALVGPCKNLRELSLPFSDGWGACEDEEASADWVDEAFGEHTQLAILAQLPSLSESAVERILGHLPGLVELTVGTRPMSTHLLAVLARSCPRLQVLRCDLSDDGADTIQLTSLTPLSGILKELSLWGDPSSESLAALVGGLSAVTSLKLHRCPPAALEPIASHLTTLELSAQDDEDLPGPWLCRLETLSLSISGFSAPLARLLAVNQATLHSLTLVLVTTLAPSLMASSLRALPYLTHLDLSMQDTKCVCAFSDLVPPELVDRLECLNMYLNTRDPVRIVSRRLQRLGFSLGMTMTTDSLPGLALDCPVLAELDLHGRLASLRCPRLRTLRLPAQGLDGVTPMPDLAVVELRQCWWHSKTPPRMDPVSLLLTGSPRLQELIGARLAQPHLLARLCACGSLVWLEHLRLDVARLPNPLVLRLPGQLEHLRMGIESSGADHNHPATLDLRVEAPGLLDFKMTIVNASLASLRLRLHDCPRLAHLGLSSYNHPGLFSLQVDDEDDAMLPQLRSLRVEGQGGIDAASLVGVLARHGARLRSVSVEVIRSATHDDDDDVDWPEVMKALSGLPRLALLSLGVSEEASSSSPLSLACPQLRSLILHRLPDRTKVRLACPLLEDLDGIRFPGCQLELALPAPNLRL
ncbi:hypothetical protein PAPYR_6047 [Paratrimastix pyriformis]|uniref:Uncharacterized protein n=1 Tax=Paratrimastix pyriformis TaxID=342808 RepID=A0ABQ8UG39_9EUKA|nr:hypothetical protein PAPYR_6047 [Paratrimastix pyriformis]